MALDQVGAALHKVVVLLVLLVRGTHTAGEVHADDLEQPVQKDSIIQASNITAIARGADRAAMIAVAHGAFARIAVLCSPCLCGEKTKMWPPWFTPRQTIASGDAAAAPSLHSSRISTSCNEIASHWTRASYKSAMSGMFLVDLFWMLCVKWLGRAMSRTSITHRKSGRSRAEICSRTAPSIISLATVKGGFHQSATNCKSIIPATASHFNLQALLSITTTVELRQQTAWYVSTGLCRSK